MVLSWFRIRFLICRAKDVDYYLNQAGGYSDNAKKSKKFIVYMNGQVTKVKGSGKKQIEPGCEIIVPSKAKKKANIGNIFGLCYYV